MNDTESSRILSEKEFNDFLLSKYEPSSYEKNELVDKRFYEGTSYSHLCRTRCFLVYREIARSLSGIRTVIDLGVFPGTLVRQLKILLKDRVLCYGAGLKIDDDFRNFMSSYVEKCIDIELDPFYLKSNDRIHIPFETGYFDAVIATEILEHLISPIEMISEGSRILRNGGLFIITTPNVSHIGAVYKLLMGRSNYERLERSPMYLQNDPWRGHIRFYDKRELETLLYSSGLELIYHRYYRELGWSHAKSSWLKKLVIRMVDKCAPIYREGHFAVFKKI